MIIQCPACATRYVVPDSAIGAEGRTVRCAKCRHSWFQDGPEVAAGPPPPPPPPPPPVETPPTAETPPPDDAVPADAPEDIVAPAAAAEPAPSPVEEADVERPPVGDEPVAPPAQGAPREGREQATPASHFDPEPPFRRRRNPLKLWTWAAAIFALVVAATIFAVSYWGVPAWVPVSRPIFAAAQPGLQLEFPADQQIKRKLPNGSEYFGVSGTITNIGSTARHVPSILIVLRDAQNRIVYSWEVIPDKRTLGPGEKEAVNEAVTEVPTSARVAEIGWKPG